MSFLFKLILTLTLLMLKTYAEPTILIHSRSGMHMYYPISQTTSNGVITPSTVPHKFYNAAVMFNGRAYFIGGVIGDNIEGAHDKVASYDPITSTWRTEPSLNVRRAQFGVTVLEDSIIVCGGYKVSDYRGSNYAWDPVNTLRF
jgi:hypothetical protein